MVMPQNEISEDLQHLSHEFPSVHVIAVTINAYCKTVCIFGNRVPAHKHLHQLCSAQAVPSTILLYCYGTRQRGLSTEYSFMKRDNLFRLFSSLLIIHKMTRAHNLSLFSTGNQLNKSVRHLTEHQEKYELCFQFETKLIPKLQSSSNTIKTVMQGKIIFIKKQE